MSTYLLITPKDDELYHYGVRGMKWGARKAHNMDTAATTASGGASIYEIEEAEKESQDELDRQKALNEYFANKKGMTPAQRAFHEGTTKRSAKKISDRIEAGRRKVEQIRRMAKELGLELSHSDEEVLTAVMQMTEDDLEHHGILGMKWGIRRFQPYQKGERVKGGKEVGQATKVKQRPSSGGIVEKYKNYKVASKRKAALKKATATRKANLEFEASKKKAIESGTVEDLAKFKGQLTNEEYGRAFMRLQNEQKLNQMVAANQKTVWDKVDKGMEIVARVSKYAGTIANAKNNYDAMQDALHKKEREAEKERKTTEKNKFITNIDNITELNEGMDKYKLTPQEYQSAMDILANKKRNKITFGTKEGSFDEDFVDQNKKAEKELDKKRRSRLQHSAEIGETFLEHHGIKGQKWGVRRFQDKSGRRTAAGKERDKTRRLLNSGKTITEGHSYDEEATFMYRVDADTREVEERVFPDGRVIYPAIATVIKDFENDHAGNPYPGPKGFDGLYDRVNPGYGEPGTTNNCPFVGVAMEIGSRGYAVTARRSLGGASVGCFKRWFKGADTQKCDTWDEMSSDLKNMDDGASGVMQGYYGSGLGSGCGGHTLHWRKENGKVIVADGQSHKEMDFDNVQNSYGFGSKGCFFTRLDNCEPNWDNLAEDGVLGLQREDRKIASKSYSTTVAKDRWWDAKKFYGYDDVREMTRA